MGIAKSIEAYAIYSDYTENSEMFIKTLSDKLDADFFVSSFDEEYEPLHKVNLLTTFSKPNKYRLTVCYDEYNKNGKTALIPHYELKLPNILKFKNIYINRQEAIERYEKLRREYINFFKRIGIDSIFIVTHAYYKIESLEDIDAYPILTFSDIPKIAKEKDNLTSFDFENILRTERVEELCKDFLLKPDLNIALIDNLNPLK